MLIVICGANAVVGPPIARWLREARATFWSMHSLFEGTPGRKGTRWERQLPPAARLYTVRAALAGEVKYLLSCKTRELWADVLSGLLEGERRLVVTLQGENVLERLAALTLGPD